MLVQEEAPFQTALERDCKQNAPSNNDGILIPAMDLSSLRSANRAGMELVSSYLPSEVTEGDEGGPSYKKTPSHFHDSGLEIKSWHRPTLPYSHPYSTIGSEGLNFSVRNGKRCYTLDIDTRKNITIEKKT